jgi:hypothetical protein
MRDLIVSAAVALSVAALSACGPTYRMDAPDGFVKYTKGHGDFAWTTADGVRVKAREVKNEPKAELPFWTDATTRHLTARGYTKKVERCFTTRAGQKACTLEWLAPRGNEDWVYAVTIFVTGDRVTLVEAAGPFARYVAVEAKLSKALETFEPGT